MNLTMIKICCIGLTILAFLGSTQVSSKAALPVKTSEVDFFNQQQNRPTKVKLWYQAAAQPCEAKICLSSTQNSDKVAIISHGAFGSPREMNWLGYALAAQGWVVAGVAHFGESWVYGAENIDPSSAMRFWLRPQDISFTIDSLASRNLFNRTLNTNKVIMLGHSAGGFTALALAGAKLANGKSEAYCTSAIAKKDKGCDYGQQSRRKPMSAKTLNQVGIFQAQMYDERVIAVIALDPALGHAISEQSLQTVKVPVLVIGSVENDFLPYTAHAKFYAEHVPEAKLIGIKQGAGHFVYIDKCDSERQVKGVFLCRDRAGVNRKAIQTQILGHVMSFIYSNGLD
jgi:predicted dienelactone hydrolase